MAPPAGARPWRPEQIPNGRKFNCCTCHVDEAGGGPRNAFGRLVEANVALGSFDEFWDAVKDVDSDGDGLLNREELLDFDGTWEWNPDDPIPDPGDFDDVNNPGFPEDFIRPVAVDSVNVPPGAAVQVTVSLSQDAPEGGIEVFVESSGPAAFPVPASVIVPGGGRSTDFEVQTRHVVAITEVGLTASHCLKTGQGSLTITPFFFVRGDVDQDEILGTGDAVSLLRFLLRVGAAPNCLKAADANDSGQVSLADAVHILQRAFLPPGQRPVIPEPDAACGADLTPDLLGCKAFQPCD